MKKYLLPSIKLTALMILLCAVLYPLLIAGIAKLAPPLTISVNGKVVGYENIGQKFTADKYFQGRPSAVDYNAAGSAGSNKGPSNPEYLSTVKARIDSFLVHNPGVKKEDIPAEMLTASGSGLDPDISPAAAYIQVQRVATARKLDQNVVKTLVAKHVDEPLLGPEKVNVLKLNIELDKLIQL
jgi:K+-transporting ATPase ATPase C chain